MKELSLYNKNLNNSKIAIIYKVSTKKKATYFES